MAQKKVYDEEFSLGATDIAKNRNQKMQMEIKFITLIQRQENLELSSQMQHIQLIIFVLIRIMFQTIVPIQVWKENL